MRRPFSHALLFVSDVARMTGFYSSVFGLTPEPGSDPGFLHLRGAPGEAGLALHAIPPHVAGPVASPAVWREDSYVKLCFEVEDVDVARAALLAAGGQAKDAWEWEGTRFCDCVDPEGNVLQLFRRTS